MPQPHPYDAARRTVTRIWVTSPAHARMPRLLSLASLHDLSDTMEDDVSAGQ